MAHPLSALAKALLLLGLVMRPDSHLRLLKEKVMREAPSEAEPLALLAQENPETPTAIQRVPEEIQLVEASLFAVRDWDSLQACHPAPATPQELQRQWAVGSPLPSARARRYWRGPGPCAFFREKLADRKCNRAVRCGGHPIFVRCRSRRNRRAPAGCDNKYNRSQRKHARRVRPFPIAAADKYRCPPRRIAD